jgi:raffinose/stachyose/melibiose transport system substrate-binding protein
MQRKIRLLVLVAAFVMLLAGCVAAPAPAVQQPAQTGAGEAVDGATKSLELWMLTDDVTKAYFEGIVSGFNAANPGVEVVMRSYPNEAYKTAVQVAIGSDDPPDIFFNWAGDDTGRFVREGHILDLAPYAAEFGWNEAFSPAALNAFTYDNFLAGGPYSLEAKYYYYNKAIFEKEGLSAPQSFDELLALCTTLRDKGYTPMSFGNQERWEGVHYLSIFNQKVVGEEVIEQDYLLAPSADQLFADPNYAAAFQKLVDMQNAGCFGDGVNSTTPDVAVAQFYTEQVPMYYQGTWAIGILAANEFEGKYGMFRMPAITDGAGNQNYVLMGPIALEVSSKTPYPDEAAAFVNYFVSVESQQQLLDELNRLPVRNDVDTGNTNEAVTFVIDDLSKAEGATTWLDVVLENSVSEIYLNAIQEVLAGTKTPAEAAEAVRAQALVAKEKLDN